MSRYRDRITVLVPTLTPGYGGQLVEDWAAAAEVADQPAWVHQYRSDEDTERRETTETLWHCGVPTTVDLQPTYRVRWDGRVLQVHGDVADCKVRGRLDHHEATLRLASDA